MSWRKYFTTVPSQAKLTARLEELNREGMRAGTAQKLSSYLPEVYAGAPNRIERYVTYDQADLDSEINRALDTIAEFCTQNQDDDDPLPFRIVYTGEVTETETSLLKDALRQWTRINKLNQRIFKIFRNTIKYGDQFFIRDPETYELMWVDSSKMEKIIVNEAEGKKIERYVVRDLDFNLQSLVATNPLVHDQYSFPGGYPRSSNPASGSGNINYGQPTTPGSRTSRFYNPQNAVEVDAAHVVHLTLSEGMDQYWPFGISILEAVYKTYKQKDLLEDCMLIYRIVRAPERRVFYIDVGQLQGQRAMAYVERVKNEIYQRRMPNSMGGGSSIIDTAYNPISITEDFFLATNAEQRGNKIDTLAAGDNLGCFSLDTKIKLLDGRDLSISEIAAIMQQGEKLWTYSCHPVSGSIAPGLITWAGKTRSNAQVLRLTLDNGETITCTPDHKFPIRGVGFVEAKDLTVGQSLTAIYTRNKPLGEYCLNDYTQYYDHVEQTWQYTHRMVAKFMRELKKQNDMTFDEQFMDSPKNVVHHVDHNRFNNSPDNLAWMNWYDHKCYHAAHGFSAQAQAMGSRAARDKILDWKTNDPDAYQQLIDKQNKGRAKWRSTVSQDVLLSINSKISSGIKTFWQNANQQQKSDLQARMTTNSQLAVQAIKKLVEQDPQYYTKQGPKIAQAIALSRQENPEKWQARAAAISAANYQSWADGARDHVHTDQKFTYTDTMLQMATTHYQAGCDSIAKLCDAINDSGEFMYHWHQTNISLHNQSKFQKFEYQHLIALLNTFGLDWHKFKLINTNIDIDPQDSAFKQMLEWVKQSTSQQHFTQISGISRFNLLKAASKYGFTDYRTIKSYTDIMNHRITKIEYLEETMDVGTLTVDGDEIYHDYHTYALSAGVFVKNSIDDLKYFNNKLMRGLGIPSSYLPTGPDDGTAVYNDGKVGTAFIQEYRFNKYCQRLQNLLAPPMDMEFKLFLKNRGIEVHSSLFNLAFNPPQSFSQYREMALDNDRVNIFSSVMNSDAQKYLSKRWAMERYLGLNKDDILENERMWKEENSDRVKDRTGVAPAEMGAPGLGAIGLRPGPEPEMEPLLGGSTSEEVPPTEAPAPAPAGAPAAPAAPAPEATPT